MGYVRTAGMSTAARRARRRAALVILSLLLGLLLAFGVAVATMQGWITFSGDGDDGDAVTATTEAPEVVLAPGDIVVNVLNSTDTAGLAGRTADALRTRGYAVDQVGNDGTDVTSAGVIRHGPEGLAAAEALQEALPEGITLEADERTDESVDLVLGDAWEELPTAEDAVEDSESGADGEDG